MDHVNYEAIFPHLYDFLCGYFNQDWEAFYAWGDENPSYQAVVSHWKTKVRPQDVDALMSDLARFLELPLSDAELQEVLTRQFVVAYLPRDMSYRAWLESLLPLLADAPPRRLRDIDEVLFAQGPTAYQMTTTVNLFLFAGLLMLFAFLLIGTGCWGGTLPVLVGLVALVVGGLGLVWEPLVRNIQRR